MPEIVPCNICGATKNTARPQLKKLLNIPVDFNIVECDTCNLTFLNPRPSQDDYARYYDHSNDYGIEAYLQRVQPRLNFYQKRIENLEQILGRKGKLLEIGCAAGIFLSIAKHRGWEVSGVEISQPLSNYAREIFGLDIYTASNLAEANLPENSFDIIYSRHVLEHTLDPKSILQEAYRLLKPGGYLYLEVPNQLMDSRAIIKKYLISLIGHRGAGAIYQQSFSDIHHVYFFTPKSFRHLVSLAGFHVKKIETWDPLYELVKGLKPLEGYWLNNLICRVSSWFDRGPVIIIWAHKDA